MFMTCMLLFRGVASTFDCGLEDEECSVTLWICQLYGIGCVKFGLRPVLQSWTELCVVCILA